VENIGARRLHTILERILEDVSFRAPELAAAARAAGLEQHVAVVDKEQVCERLGELMERQDLSKYIL
jgi:ATP-dependent HslUV protease ATP-binding subunit HslU